MATKKCKNAMEPANTIMVLIRVGIVMELVW